MKLKTVICQKATEIVDDASHSAYDLAFDQKEVYSYEDYAKIAREMEKRIGERTIEEHEDLHWQSLSPKAALDDSVAPLYAIDNEKSLFPRSCQIWNLKRFTHKESIIHRVRKYLLLFFAIPICIFYCDFERR